MPPTTSNRRRWFVQQEPRQKGDAQDDQAAPDEQPRIAKPNELRGDARDQFSTTPAFKQVYQARRGAKRGPIASEPELQQPVASAKPKRDLEKDQNISTLGSDASEVMLLDQHGNALEDAQQSSQWNTTLTLSPKRPRNEIEKPSFKPSKRSLPTAASTFKPAHQTETTRRRFTHSTASQDHKFSQTVGSRPSFLVRSVTAQPEEASVPVPEAFSPHRRGPKFVPGGMAATLHTWTVETGQTAMLARRAQFRGLEEEFVMHITIAELLSPPSSRHLMLTGSVHDGRIVSALLIDVNIIATLDEASQLSLRPGQLLGFREPCWNVNACNRQWVVCVDWKVIGP